MGLRINHNLASLGAALNLGKANSALSSSLAKLSTGLKINTAADGPADLIISEKFRSQINSISKATENTQNAISMLSTAEGALAEVNSLLTKMQGLALKASQTGTQDTDEIAASQAEIDAALESINTISRNTSFGTVNLLDGSQSIQTTGVDTDNILVDIDKANFAGDSKNVSIEVIDAAARAETTIDLTAAGQGGGADGVLTNSQVLKVTGNRGSDTITFAAGTTVASIAEEINSRTTQTGVFAESANSMLTLKSAAYGATEFVTVEDVDGDNDLLDINPETVVPGSATNEFVADLTSANNGLGKSFTIGGVEVRTYGEQGSKFDGYTVDFAVGSVGATPVVAVNEASKLIQITASTGTTVAAIATALTTETSISFGAVISGTATVTATDAADDLTVSDVTSNLVITAKAGKAAATHSETATISIAFSATASAAYETATNTLTLFVVSNVSYTQATLASVITVADASAPTVDLGGMFEFEMVNGSGLIDRTSTDSKISLNESLVDTSTKGVDLSDHAGTGLAFAAGGVSDFSFKTTAAGADKYAGYTVTVENEVTSVEVSINDSLKTITITASATTTVGSVITALSAADAGMFLSTAKNPAADTFGTITGEVTSQLANEGVNLKVSAKANDADFFYPRITVSNGAANAISYNEATETITLVIAGDSNVIDTQSELESLLDDSTTGAQIRSLFDLEVTGAITGTTVDSVKLDGGFTGGATSTSGSNTNYIKVEGIDGTLEVNGVKTAANNLTYTFDNGNIRGHITLDEGMNEAGKTSAFTISGKGAFLQLGQKTQLSHQIGVGIQSIAIDQLATGLYLDNSLDPATSNLTDAQLYTTATLADIKAGGEFDLAKNAQTAYDIISNAITEVSVSRAKLGALISNTLESNINSLGVAFENLTAAESRIRDVDFAAETAEFTRAQILVQAGTSVAAQANVATQAALQLLG
jgi:flagellin